MATQDVHALTDKEKATLRLLLAGHDAKSMARHLGLSVHTVNERLRDARRKLSVSSSREAARRLSEAEAADPENAGDNSFGDAPTDASGQEGGEPGARFVANPRTAWAIGGLVMLPLAFALLALSGAPEAAQKGAATPAAPAAAPAVAESDATRAARQFLALVDAGNWDESYAAWAPSFRTLNTLETWRSVSEGGRVPLGRVLSRSLISEENIPAPPHGYQLVRFRTDFANRPGATERLSLARDGDRWRVAGYIIE
jgi:DNA-binding CsgD family transcriptional regulator